MKRESQDAAQLGHGEFAFGVDVTGLQTFLPASALSHRGEPPTERKCIGNHRRHGYTGSER